LRRLGRREWAAVRRRLGACCWNPEPHFLRRRMSTPTRCRFCDKLSKSVRAMPHNWIDWVLLLRLIRRRAVISLASQSSRFERHPNNIAGSSSGWNWELATEN